MSATVIDMQRQLRNQKVAQVMEELEQHLQDADRHAIAYVRRLVDQGYQRRTLYTPRPRGLHPRIAELIREIERDVDVMHRRSA